MDENAIGPVSREPLLPTIMGYGVDKIANRTHWVMTKTLSPGAVMAAEEPRVFS